MSKQQVPVPAQDVLEARQALCDAEVTLDGQRARVCGYRNRFATVRQLPSGLSAEWAWDAAARIIAAGGEFTTGQHDRLVPAPAAPYPAMRPAADAWRPSCLVMNPQNARASEARRAKLLAAFDGLDCNERADFLEEIEHLAHTGQDEPWKHDVRELFARLYAAAGLEQPS